MDAFRRRPFSIKAVYIVAASIGTLLHHEFH